MEIIIAIIIWFALGALHLPLYEYWWTDGFDYTKGERRHARWLALLGPISLIGSMFLALPLLFKPRVGDHTIISRRRTK